MLDDSKPNEPDKNHAADDKHVLHLGVTDVPPLPTALIYGLQQALICVSSLLVHPLLVSETVCAGSYEAQLRVQLISATFVTAGLATLMQTTFGLRLSVLQGPASAFLPPLFAYRKILGNCSDLSENNWEKKLQEIQGSLLVASITFVLIGSLGLGGRLSKLIGPITIVPLMILLAISIAPIAEEKMSLHWISLVMLASLVTMIVYLENVQVPIFYYDISSKKFGSHRVRLFGQFPYLLSLSLVWFICFMLTISNFEPPDGEARTDKNSSVKVLQESPWLQIPYPGQFGMPGLNAGLCLGFVASCFSSVIENIGSYNLLARVSQQRQPPMSAVNRAVIMEGLGSMLAALMGVCIGVTAYSENIALIHITKVASRWTMQLAGIILIILGLFTKLAALLASIPDALVGGVLMMGISMISGVTLSNLRLIDLQLTRNLTIMGISLISGIVVPQHLEKHPFNTESSIMNEILNMLLSIKMLVGGVIAVFLDNSVPGATLKQRGLMIKDLTKYGNSLNEDGYSFSEKANRLLKRFSCLKALPFMPSTSSSLIRINDQYISHV